MTNDNPTKRADYKPKQGLDPEHSKFAAEVRRNNKKIYKEPMPKGVRHE